MYYFLVRREDRIESLKYSSKKRQLAAAETRELSGLLLKGKIFEEQYDPSYFSEAHRDFKERHNSAFVSLAKYCQATHGGPINIFYLDGPGAGTTSALQNAGFDGRRCFVANKHDSSCKILRSSGLPDDNVEHASAEDSLRGDALIGRTSFSAYYFDGCGGYMPLIWSMIHSACDEKRMDVPLPIAIGFSIIGGYREAVDKEQDVFRELARMVKCRGLRVIHVLDDPERFGIDPSIRKVEGATLTSWALIEAA